MLMFVANRDLTHVSNEQDTSTAGAFVLLECAGSVAAPFVVPAARALRRAVCLALARGLGDNGSAVPQQAERHHAGRQHAATSDRRGSRA